MKNDVSQRNLKKFYDRAIYFVYVTWGSVQGAMAIFKKPVKGFSHFP